MTHSSLNQGQLALNLSLSPIVFAEKRTTTAVRELFHAITGETLSDAKIRQLGKDSNARIPYPLGWLTIFPSTPEKCGRRYLWNVAAIPTTATPQLADVLNSSF